MYTLNTFYQNPFFKILPRFQIFELTLILVFAICIFIQYVLVPASQRKIFAFKLKTLMSASSPLLSQHFILSYVRYICCFIYHVDLILPENI